MYFMSLFTVLGRLIRRTTSHALREIHILENRDKLLKLITEKFLQKNSRRHEKGLQGRLKELITDNRVTLPSLMIISTGKYYTYVLKIPLIKRENAILNEYSTVV